MYDTRDPCSGRESLVKKSLIEIMIISNCKNEMKWQMITIVIMLSSIKWTCHSWNFISIIIVCFNVGLSFASWLMLYGWCTFTYVWLRRRWSIWKYDRLECYWCYIYGINILVIHETVARHVEGFWGKKWRKENTCNHEYVCTCISIQYHIHKEKMTAGINWVRNRAC